MASQNGKTKQDAFTLGMLMKTPVWRWKLNTPEVCGIFFYICFVAFLSSCLSVRPSIWRYFSTDSTFEWLFGCKVLTDHLCAYTRCCICQGSCRCLLLAQWIIGLQLWNATGRLLVCNLHQEPRGPTPVLQFVLILVRDALSLKQHDIVREDLWGGWCEGVKQPVFEGIF